MKQDDAGDDTADSDSRASPGAAASVQMQIALDSGDTRKTLARVEQSIATKTKELQELKEWQQILREQLGMVSCRHRTLRWVF